MSLRTVEERIEAALPSMPGWCTVEKGKRVAALTYGAELCVELGVFGGRSLFAIGLALADQGSGRADGVDPYTASASLEGVNDPANDEWWSTVPYGEIADYAEAMLQNASLADRVRIVRKRSADAVADYADGSIDLLHQDSNHSEAVSCEEVVLWAPKVRPGGTWIFDDANWPSTQAAQRMLLDRGFTLEEDYGAWRVFHAPGNLLEATYRAMDREHLGGTGHAVVAKDGVRAIMFGCASREDAEGLAELLSRSRFVRAWAVSHELREAPAPEREEVAR